MKRLSFAVYFLLCLAVPALADTAIVIPSFQEGTTWASDKSLGARGIIEELGYIFDHWGRPYQIFPAGVAKTEYCRTGLFTLGDGPNARTRQFDAVVHDWKFGTANKNRGGYTADSLGLSWNTSTGAAMKLLVPNLFMTITAPGFSAGLDSTGQTSNTGGNGNYTTCYLSTNPTLTWNEQNDEGEVAISANAPGGIRPIIGSSYSARTLQEETPTVPFACVWCDSMIGPVPRTGLAKAVDTLQVWDALKVNATGSMPFTIVSVSHQPDGGHNPENILFGLAHLDSLSGGKVFDPNKLPIRIGVQIHGAFRRNARTAMGGMSPNDTTNVQAVNDSLANLGIPISLLVDVDSLSAFPRDKVLWARNPYLRYAPESYAGLATNTKEGTQTPGGVSGNSTAANPIDALGAARTRAFYGDGTAAGADTSIWAGVVNLYSLMASNFGATNVDHSLAAPLFDWTPNQMTLQNMSNWDSLLACLAKAGVRNVVINAHDPRTDPTHFSNFKSITSSPRTYTIPYKAGGVSILGMSGSTFPVIATGFFADSGSCTSLMANINSWNAPGAQNVQALSSFWTGLLRGRELNKGAFSPGTAAGGLDSLGEGGGYPIRILTLHVSDLGSGTATDWATRPTRPGWWEIKALANEITAINALAGRTIIKIVPCEQVTNK